MKNDVLQSLLSAASAPARTNPVGERLASHLAGDTVAMQTLTELVDHYQHVNLQTALDAYLGAPGRTYELVGVQGGDSSGILGMSLAPQLSTLLTGSQSNASFGSVDYINRPLGPSASLPCVRRGLYLIEDAGSRLAVWVREKEGLGTTSSLAVDVVSSDMEASHAFLDELRRLMAELNVFRGQVVTFGRDPSGSLQLGFSERFVADRDAVILPPGTLDLLEEQTIGIAGMRDVLRDSGRHLKRGVLLYGPPGTGKTHTIRYLVSQLTDYTVFFVTGALTSALRGIAELVRQMTPAVVVFDDVDVIAEERPLPGQGSASTNRLLFDLLDFMDGLHEDMDIVFILTTNRIEAIESAIATRPGRVDTALEIPLPDAAARRNLLDLYASGLDLRLADVEAVISRTEGVTASFIREMLRRATLVAARHATPGEPLVVEDADVHAALDRLLDPASPLTSALLGRRPGERAKAAVGETD